MDARHLVRILWSGLWLLAGTILDAKTWPKSFTSCDRHVTLSKQPARVIAIDINITEMVLSLGAEKQLVGIAGIKNPELIRRDLRQGLGKIPLLSESYPAIENIVAAKADFVVAGWNYGFSSERGVHPAKLESLGIPSYAIRESCIRIGEKNEVSFEDVYYDLHTLGEALGKEDQAAKIIQKMKDDLSKLSFLNRRSDIPVFLYDSGEKAPFTAGRFAMPHTMINTAGGKNIFADLNTSWSSVNWEDVIARDPHLIIIVNYGGNNGLIKQKYLENHSSLKNLTAIRKKQFLILDYAEVTPGVRNTLATLKINQKLKSMIEMQGHR